MKRAFVSLALCVAVASGLAAQETVPPHSPGPIGPAAGSGKWPALAVSLADARGYTLYRPARMPRGRLPLVLWGNGACADNGLSASHFLREIASHGYIVVANGAPRGEATIATTIDPLAGPRPPAAGQPFAPPRAAADETSVAQLLAGIDWARGADRDPRNPLAGHVDLGRIAVMGHSCGGLQALKAGADPRIDTVVAFDSGVYERPKSGLSQVDITKADLKKLHTPLAYVLGGATDIAYPNGMDDFARIDHLPVLVASQPVGHLGTFRLKDGGDWARFAVDWLDWRLKGSRRAGLQFVGAQCGLCSGTPWTITRKNFPGKP